jgi:CRP-like cAMP-binding protein
MALNFKKKFFLYFFFIYKFFFQGPGEIVGELSFITDFPRTCSVIGGEGGCTVLELTRDDFQK